MRRPRLGVDVDRLAPFRAAAAGSARRDGTLSTRSHTKVPVGVAGGVLAHRDAHGVDAQVVERDAGELQIVGLRSAGHEAARVGGGGVRQTDAHRRAGLAAAGRGCAREERAEPAGREGHFRHGIA